MDGHIGKPPAVLLRFHLTTSAPGVYSNNFFRCCFFAHDGLLFPSSYTPDKMITDLQLQDVYYNPFRFLKSNPLQEAQNSPVLISILHYTTNFILSSVLTPF